MKVKFSCILILEQLKLILKIFSSTRPACTKLKAPGRLMHLGKGKE